MDMAEQMGSDLIYENVINYNTCISACETRQQLGVGAAAAAGNADGVYLCERE